MMTLSLKKRIGLSFVLANIVVLILGFTVFYFLSSMNKKISEITINTNKVSLLTDEIRISAVSILKTQKKILTIRANEEDLEKLKRLCLNFQVQLQKLDSLYSEVEVKTIISRMLGYIDSLQTLLTKVSVFHRDNVALETIGDLADKILESFSEFQDIQYYQSEQRDNQIKSLIGQTKQQMLIVLVITFLGTIILGMMIPGKIALPFKKINDAVRELQDCNFDVSIYYDKNDEIGELARELNKMIHNMKHFEELRTNRISVQHRKFDILANLIRKNILIVNAKGELIYLNNQMYNLLRIESVDVINKNIGDTLIPNSIKEAYEMALKRRSKIENAPIIVTQREVIDSKDEETGDIVTKESEVEKFTGYANIIPIRAMESDGDYYMMILSQEMFT